MRYWKLGIVTFTVMTCAAGAVHADPVGEYAKLLAGDGDELDALGWSVATDGTTAIIGAIGDDYSGSAYLFDTITGQHLFKLLPSDGEGGGPFGYSVAIHGTTAIVGAWQDRTNGIRSGSAFLFDTTTGQQTFHLLPSDGAMGDAFGGSVAISGTTAIVGADQNDDNGLDSGSTYLFDTTTGKQLFKLLPNDGNVVDFFGQAVAICGTIAIVGAPWDDDNGSASGSAYLFDTNTGQQIFKLLPDDGVGGDFFGESVAISGTTAIVGAWAHDESASDSGAAYLFDTTTGQQRFKLLPNDGAFRDTFGKSVAINGTTAIVGAPADNVNGSLSGSAYLFDTATGQQLFKILASDGDVNDQFGRTVSISGTTAIIGAVGDDDNGENAGAAYLFDARGGEPLCTADLDNNGAVDTADLGILLGQFGFTCP